MTVWWLFLQETSIELLIIGEDGIAQSVCEQAVFGTIKDLAVIPWNDKFYARNPQVCWSNLLNNLWAFLLLIYHDIVAICRVLHIIERPTYFWAIFVEVYICLLYVNVVALLFCRLWRRICWLFFLIPGSSHFSHFAMKCTGFSFSSWLAQNCLSMKGRVSHCLEMCASFLKKSLIFWNRFSAVAHVQLSGPGNSRSQLGRMLAVDPRQVAFICSRMEAKNSLVS